MNDAGSVANRAAAWRWALSLVVICTALRLVLIGYEPLSYPDTGSYLQASQDLLSGDHHSVGQARRTPGYPLMLALAGNSPQVIVLLQIVAGLATGLLLFGLTLRLTGRPTSAFVGGLPHHLNLQQLFQEATLLTETLSALATTAAVALFVLLLRPLLLQRRRLLALVASLPGGLIWWLHRPKLPNGPVARIRDHKL